MKIYKIIAIGFLTAIPLIHVFAKTPAGVARPPEMNEEVARGEYLVRVSGCNDCHTPGYTQFHGQSSQNTLLTGDSTALEGPWGTTFSTNLRLSLRRFNDEQWLGYARDLNTLPPMPWFNLRSMNDEDLIAILRYVQWLGPKGEPAPQPLPPGEEWVGTAIKFAATNP